jgi:hypothetical protein
VYNVQLKDLKYCIDAVIDVLDITLRYVDRLPVETSVTDRASFVTSKAGHHSSIALTYNHLRMIASRCAG